MGFTDVRGMPDIGGDTAHARRSRGVYLADARRVEEQAALHYR